MFARTERLLLRPGWAEDAPALFQAIADEGIVRNLATAPWPYSFADAQTFLMRERRPQDAACLIFLRGDGAPTARRRRRLRPHAPDRPGRRRDRVRLLDRQALLGPWAIATEAGAALVANARETLRLPRLVAGHFTDNPASGRVLRKLGFRPTGATVQRHSAGRGGEAPCREFALELAGGGSDRGGALFDGGLAVIARSEATKQSSPAPFAALDCFAMLAMTISGRRPRGQPRRFVIALGLGDQRAVVMVPGVEAGQEESEPGAEDLAQHAGAHPGEPQHPAPGARAGNAVLAEQFERAELRSTTKLRVTNSITLALIFQRLPPGQAAGRVQPGVVGDALMLDLLDRVPAPERRALRDRPCRGGADS